MRLLTGKDRKEYEDMRGDGMRMQAAIVAAESRALELGKENEWLRHEHDRERQRANNAVDALLAMRGISPISPELDVPPVTFEDPLAEDPAEVERIEADMKRLGVGAVFAQEAKG